VPQHSNTLQLRIAGNGRVRRLSCIFLVLALLPVWSPAAQQESVVPGARAEARELMGIALWGSPEASAAAVAELDELRGMSDLVAPQADGRGDFLELEEVLREGPPLIADGAGATAGAVAGGAAADPLDRSFPVRLPDGREIPVFVRLPPGYRDDVPHPVMFAMHGGPPGSEEGAIRSAARMIDVWSDAAAEAGWIIVSPAMTHVRSMGARSETRLPYEILRPEQAAAILGAVQRRFRVDPDRVVSTGISLGSNFSIGYGAAMPDFFAAIVPVSTEGDSREHLLRNLQHVPAYVLEGTQDPNIRGISGPRALGDILGRFAYDATYREFADRAHEGFQELYPDVLRWLASRPRDLYPREVIRVPHDGIMPLSRRVFWIESATRQGVVSARVSGDNQIDITARWTPSVNVYLHDRLVDLDRPVRFTVNGEPVAELTARRSVNFAIEQVRQHGDTGRAAAAVVRLAVPQTANAVVRAQALWAALEPVHPGGQLSFWEFYAVNALLERFPTLGLEGREVALPPAAEAAMQERRGVPPLAEEVGIVIGLVDPAGPFGDSGLRAGDLVIKAQQEPFFLDRGGLQRLHHWLARELTGVPRVYQIVLWRDGELRMLDVPLSLGPYRQE